MQKQLHVLDEPDSLLVEEQLTEIRSAVNRDPYLAPQFHAMLTAAYNRARIANERFELESKLRNMNRDDLINRILSLPQRTLKRIL